MMRAVPLVATACLASLVTADKAPSYAIPAFNYETLADSGNPDIVLSALKQDGIISLSNIPGYADARAAYLQKAAECVVSSKDASVNFLLSKELQDGTKRYTIRTESGSNPDHGAVSAVDEKCSGYGDIYTTFSDVVEGAVSKLADTLDATPFVTSDGNNVATTSRRLFDEAMRLDHFHAYEASSEQQRRLEDDDLSLQLHEDDGLFIAFPTPVIYAVEGNGKMDLVSVSSDDETGLVIQRKDGKRVRPTLKPNDLTIMIGTGFSNWIASSEKLPAVTHGMRMPDIELEPTQRMLRAWYGKMTLLPTNHRMLSQLTFGEHANLVSNYAEQAVSSDMMSIGCSPGRRLLASAASECSHNQCKVKAGKEEPADTCEVVCNRSHGTDPQICEESCDCTVSSGGAQVCWMLCVLELDECAVDAQECSGQELICNIETETPTTTPSPPAEPDTPVPTVSAEAPPSPTDSDTPASTPPSETPSPPSSDAPSPTSDKTDAPSPTSDTDGPTDAPAPAPTDNHC